VLGVGAGGPAVVEWQEAMNDWLAAAAPDATFRLDVDGSYGLLTDSVTRRFQYAQGLPIDGLVGPVTRAAYLSAPALIAAGRAPAAYETYLSRGDRGPEVRAWQIALDHWIDASGSPVAPVDADGIYGPSTEAAVRFFQESEGVTVDGLVGTETRAALASAPVLVNVAPVAPPASSAPVPVTTPAAGVCAASDATIVEIVLHVDVPDPRCVRLTALQWVRIVNDGPATGVTFGTWRVELEAGASATTPLPLGAYGPPGTSAFAVDRYGGSGPEVQVR
jgi:peptidoglycan hydrolase-like protein with peptidoglycan-binding domain